MPYHLDVTVDAVHPGRDGNRQQDRSESETNLLPGGRR
jgi:hypothetical protein